MTATVIPNPGANVNVLFTVTGAHSFNRFTVKTNSSGQAVFCYTGTRTGTDTITAFADTNGNKLQDANELSIPGTKIWTPAAPKTLTLAPASDTNRAGEPHCVTATVKDQSGNPTPAIAVVFKVSGPNATSQTLLTDTNGQVTFCYTGTKVGTDTITAFADTDSDAFRDPDEPTGTATKIYHWSTAPRTEQSTTKQVLVISSSWVAPTISTRISRTFVTSGSPRRRGPIQSHRIMKCSFSRAEQNLKHPKDNPYLGRFGSVTDRVRRWAKQVQWQGEIMCGHNP